MTKRTSAPVFKFELGEHAKDVITGLKGVVTGRCQYLTGCTQFLIQPPGAKAGQPQTSHWVDEGKLEPIKGKKRVVLTIEANGGPQHEAPKH
jgi:hypothetical protein